MAMDKKEGKERGRNGAGEEVSRHGAEQGGRGQAQEMGLSGVGELGEKASAGTNTHPEPSVHGSSLGNLLQGHSLPFATGTNLPPPPLPKGSPLVHRP